MSHIKKWTEYRDTRVASYDFRCQTRYKAAADRLFAVGLLDCHTVVDVGAGSCQFGRYLHERGFRGTYLPIDAVIDGTDLEIWAPKRMADFFVCLEVLEHLSDPYRLLSALRQCARLGLVVTTPNCEAVDVLACDPTHQTCLPGWTFTQMAMNVETHSWFGVPNDTLLAWRQYA